ncbi:Paraquat-inducible protein B [Monaibacterium marinum]|uniref:Paraquat-inducible protein B n=2 Tax=Pontivivens marinum TaxID=1690039 RepID=A0A2C9CUL8_9RHOB|nr:Paraquat-inducible protein B [Monaibacterium marinum]
MTDMPQPPAPRIETEAHTPLWKRFSLVWAIPLVALIVAAVVTVQTFTSRGPVVVVHFASASGVSASQTVLRYRDVTIGHVEEVGFGAGLNDVLVHIRLEPEIAPYVTSEAVFWIVEPEITAQGISGLSTVISGSYLSVQLPMNPGRTAYDFTGLERAPLTPLDEPGLRLTLNTSLASSISIGSPMLFKGIEVGQVEDVALSDDGSRIVYTAFVREPYNDLINEGTRFWDASGFSFNLDTSGASLDVGSLTALLRGGVTFDTVFPDGKQVTAERAFRLYPDADTARSSLFDTLVRAPVTISAVFPGSVNGLRVGAQVSYRGIPVGSVTSVSARLAGEQGSRAVELLAAFEIEPGRFGLPSGADASLTLALLGELVADSGLRAQLTSPSILSGSQSIELAEIPDAEPAELNLDNRPFPRIPTVETPTSGLAETAEGLITRIDELPVEAIMTAATQALNAVTSLLSDPELRQIPVEANAAISDLRGLLQSDGVKQAPGELLAGLTALRGLLEDAQEAALVEAFTTTVADISALARTVDQTTSELTPDLAATLRATQEFVSSAQGLIDDPAARSLPTQAAALLSDIQAVTSSPALQSAPDALGRALAQAEDILAEFGEADIAGRLATALQEGASAATGIAALTDGAADLPETLAALIEDVDALANTANTFLSNPELAAAPAELTGVLRSARGILDDEATQALPAETLASLVTINRTLAAIDDANVAQLLGETLSSATQAAASLSEIAEASKTIPDALSGVIAEVDTILSDPQTQALPAQATASLAALRALLEDPSTQAIPADISAGVRSARALLDDLVAAELGERLQTALADAGRAAASVAQATDGVPELMERIGAVVSDAENVELDQLAQTAQDVLRSADAILAAPGAQDLPAILTEALREVRLTLQDLRGAGVAQGLGDTLSAAERTMEAIRLAAVDVPDLLARLDALSVQSSATIAAYGEGSVVNDEALRAIREFRDTARAITALVRQIERNPNSLLIGR